MLVQATLPLTKKVTKDNWKDTINPAALSLDEAVDLYADFKAIEAAGKMIGGYLREIVRSKMPDAPEPVYVGTHYSVQVNYRSRAGGLNKELILEEMGEAWVEEHSLPPTEYEELRIKPVTA